MIVITTDKDENEMELYVCSLPRQVPIYLHRPGRHVLRICRNACIYTGTHKARARAHVTQKTNRQRKKKVKKKLK
ncbi:hypothetical protein PUN28_004551 [Cardiocondyla obscurior]|uniref:Uncharacterized protein n=1 Tax=Cardiocondyla obscurior TaxID=286306 RepID=A0AAW2GD88_9HYME